MVSLSNYCIWCLFLSYLAQFTLIVYAASLCTFVGFESMIWPSIRFDISLQNFKKPWDIFAHHSSGCREKTLSDFLASRSSPSKKINTAPGSRLKAGFHQRRSRSRSRKRSKKSAYDLVKIKNRSSKRSHKGDGIGVRRIRTFPFPSDSAYDSVAYVPLMI